MSKSGVDSILSGCSVFITGGTGFLGRALVEKILRCIPSIKKVYLILRPQKSEGNRSSPAPARTTPTTPARTPPPPDAPQAQAQRHLPGSRCDISGRCCCSRITEMFKSTLFDRLRASGSLDSLVEEKVVAIAGDLLEPKMGISEADIAFLQNEVDLIIHLGANIDFLQPMMECVRPNCLGALNVLEFAHTCNKLRGFVHTSTAWASSSTPGFIREVLPKLKMKGKNADPEELLNEILRIEKTTTADKTYKQMMHATHYPNTYTFSKSLTEHLLAKLHRNVPLFIVRPSVVTGAWRDPVPGYIDQVASITAVMMAGGRGYIHDLPGQPGKIVDIIPLDMTVNTLILAGATLLKDHPSVGPSTESAPAPAPAPAPMPVPAKYDPVVAARSIRIVHATSSVLHPVSHDAMLAAVCEEFLFNPPKAHNQGRHLYAHFSPIWLIHAKLGLAKRLGVPVLKAVSAVKGDAKAKKLTELKIAQLYKLSKLLTVYEFFLRYDWKFESSMPSLSRAPEFTDYDRSVFTVDLRKVDWKIYMKNMTDSVQRFMMKEDNAPRTIIQARRTSFDHLDIMSDPYLQRNCDALITVNDCYSLPGYILSSLKVRTSYSYKLLKLYKRPKFEADEQSTDAARGAGVTATTSTTASTAAGISRGAV